MSRLFAELHRRNVIRVVIAYLAAAWLLVQIADVAVPAFGLPDSTVGILIIGLGIGLVPAIVLAWVFEFTPEGLRRDDAGATSVASGTHKTADRIIMVVLALAVSFFAVDKFVLDPARDTRREQEVAREAASNARVESFGDRSIAVLPFANRSPDPDQVYFSDGIAEEILNLLARIRDLRVISRSTSFGYRGNVDIPEIADALNVSYVLEGSVRRAGDTVRVTATLVDARANANVWSDAWDRDLVDIFAIQDEIAKHIAEELEVRLSKSASPRHTTDAETYALFLQARHDVYGQSGNFADYTRTIDMLREVIERDPEFVPAMTLLSFTLDKHEMAQELSADEVAAFHRERAHLVERAYALRPDDAVANLYKGYLEFLKGGDVAESIKYAQRSLELEPSNMEVLRSAGYTARYIGRLDDAAILFEQALAREPLCIPCYSGLHHTLAMAGRYEEAEGVLRRRIALIDDIGGHVNRGLMLIELGRAEEAIEIFDEWEPDEVLREAFKTAALEALGRRNEVDDNIEVWRERWLEYDPGLLADIYARRQDAKNTLHYVERLVYERPGAFANIAWSHRYAFIHDAPEWSAWRKQARLDDETLARVEFTLPDFPPTDSVTL